ncbi:MAG TPA: lipopolysaccharide kinase InaA family protein [Gemmataceae bacterium]|jgi:tRNA A-37 threonylcarbamoyl transferase component Bud32|nr:lipopolysaccharide kinase InaA family protein [Gemmataceae bacterium]
MKLIRLLISGLLHVFRRRVAFVEVNPQFRDLLKSQGIHGPEDFLNLPAIIVSGHPNRHVGRVKLGFGSSPIVAYLKKEHRLPWRDRWTNAWHGFGWCSRSYRESLVLRSMRETGVGCPEFVAVGEDGRGRAFLLVRELAESLDLRVLLGAGHLADPPSRRKFARELGETVARLHDAGFDHPDLYSKHLLVNPRNSRISLLDCQRTRKYSNLSWRRRWQDLAALDATLTEELAAPRERMRCLRSYLQASLAVQAPAPFFRKAAASIRRRAGRLLRHRHVREQRQPPLNPEAQNLIWMRGESLCVTREFYEALYGHVPEEFLLGRRRPLPFQLLPVDGSQVTQCRHSFRGVGATTLVQRRASNPIQWLWAKLRGKRLLSPEIELAGITFRLERYGVRCARVLAFGQSQDRVWQYHSFLLVQDRSQQRTISQRFVDLAEIRWTAQRKQKWRLLREAGALLGRMHRAQCYFSGRLDESLVVENDVEVGPILILTGAQNVSKRRRPSRRLARKDLTGLIRSLNSLSRTDRLRMLLSYFGRNCLSAPDKRTIKTFLK